MCVCALLCVRACMCVWVVRGCISKPSMVKRKKEHEQTETTHGRSKIDLIILFTNNSENVYFNSENTLGFSPFQ